MSCSKTPSCIKKVRLCMRVYQFETISFKELELCKCLRKIKV